MIDPRFYKSHGPIALGDLIAGLDVEVLEGRFLDEKIEGVGSLETSQPGHITFLNAKRHRGGLQTAKASACFIPENIAGLVGEVNIIPVVSKFPRSHFGRVINRLISGKTLFDVGHMAVSDFPGPKIHPTAVIAATAKIAPDVEIGPFAVIGAGVEIGAGSKIGAHATIEFAVMGENCSIKAHASIGSRGFGIDGDENGIFDLPHTGRVIMGNGVSIGCHSAVDRGFIGDTVLGDNVKVDNICQVAHNVTIGNGTMLAGHAGVSGSCNLGEGVLMGGSACLADHIDVGDGARVAAAAGVMNNIPAGETWSGIPAMPLRDHMRIVAATRKMTKRN